MKLSLGTVQFGLPYGIANRSGQVSRAKAAEIISLARSYGVGDIDTAIAYGDSEAALGQIGVRDFRVVTKLPPLPTQVGDVEAWARDQLSGSLRRLGVESVHGLLLHRSSDLLGADGGALFRALEGFKANGQVRKIGVSIYSPDELGDVFARGALDLVQAPLSLVDRRLLSSGWLKRLKDQQVEVHTRSAFLQGLLLTPIDGMPAKFSPWSKIWQAWSQWQTSAGCSALTACLAFPKSFDEVDRVVVGVDSPEHLIQIHDALRTSFGGEWPQIESDDDRLVNPSRWADLE